VNERQQSAVHVLAAKGAAELVETLVRRGADIKSVDINGETVLFHALGSGARYEAVLRLFRQGKGDLDYVNKQGVN